MGKRPGPADVLLVVEVAGNSLHYDRMVKMPLYARAGIAELWIVDLEQLVVDVYWTPVGNGYGNTNKCRSGDWLFLAGPPEIAVKLDLILE